MRGLLALTVFLALYPLQAAVLVVLTLILMVRQAGLVEVQTTAGVVFTAQLVKEFLVKVMLEACLGLAQTIPAAVVVALELLD
jgi:hypothetical protein